MVAAPETEESRTFKYYQEDFEITLDDLVGKRILDLACGSNPKFLNYCLDNGIDIVGLDYRPQTGLKAQRKRYVQGNILKPPFKDESFDLIFLRALPPRPEVPLLKMVKRATPLLKIAGFLMVAPLFMETNSLHHMQVLDVFNNALAIGADVNIIENKKIGYLSLREPVRCTLVIKKVS